MQSHSARDRLLDAVVEHFARSGLGDQSLRRIALAVGTSHRMLLYHFGSRDGLMLAVAQRVEARTRGAVVAMGEVAERGTDDLIRGVWAHVSDPGLADFERLFFALYGRALQGDPGFSPLLESDIATWLDTNAAMAEAAEYDVAPETARLHARLALAVVRGLLLDLLATGERSEVGAALEVFAARYAGAWWEGDAQPAGTSDRAS